MRIVGWDTYVERRLSSTDDKDHSNRAWNPHERTGRTWLSPGPWEQRGHRVDLVRRKAIRSDRPVRTAQQ